MTSFKAAQLIAGSKDADKVIFLMDRIELGTQSLLEYRSFADDADDVQGTENTDVLKAKLASIDPKDTLIVTSIQKMSNIKAGEGHITEEEVKKLAGKRIVFIIDECHRSTFGEMLQDIRRSFPNALYFGFTGTPIHEENRKKGSTTSMVFGDCLHRYSIADGIRDGNVLGFDPYMVLTYRDRDVRRWSHWRRRRRRRLRKPKRIRRKPKCSTITWIRIKCRWDLWKRRPENASRALRIT